jgi:alpha-glutamyl/putrescinyl thymine pyrophosphorylase clade 1
VLTTCGQRMEKAVYVVESVCGAVVHGRVRPVNADSLAAFWSRLRGIPGLGAGFLAGQVVADLKNTRGPLASAPDWWTWACAGPGSLRGLTRYTGAPVTKANFSTALNMVAGDCEERIMPLALHAQDWQNVMCEMDKYWRTRDDGKRPRTLYTPETRFTP